MSDIERVRAALFETVAVLAKLNEAIMVGDRRREPWQPP